jgi:hypothetical protein
MGAEVAYFQSGKCCGFEAAMAFNAHEDPKTRCAFLLCAAMRHGGAPVSVVSAVLFNFAQVHVTSIGMSFVRHI